MMASVRFACVVVLAAVLIPADNLNAEPARVPAQQTYWPVCWLCHETEAGYGHNPAEYNDEDPFARAKGIAMAVQFHRDNLRFQAHSVLEVLSFALGAVGVLYAIFGVACGILGGRDIWQGLDPINDNKFRRFHDFVLRGLGILIVAEIVSSVSVGINPSPSRLLVLGVIVGVRWVLGRVWDEEQKHAVQAHARRNRGCGY